MRTGILTRSTKARPNVELKRYRDALGLSQARLAELIGCSQGDIAKLETGAKRTTADWASRIAPHLGVEPQALFPSSEAEREMPVPSSAEIDPERLRLAIAVARRQATLHGSQDREDVIMGLAATIYDVLAERESLGHSVRNEEGAVGLVEAILRRLWRPPE